MKSFGWVIFFLVFSWAAAVHAEELPKFNLTSPSFKDQGAVAEKFTCHGADINPELDITGVPGDAKGMALIVDDPDAPEGIWVHWVVYNIPADAVKIKENSKVGTEGLNDFGTFRYQGPCPPNKKAHRYSFRIYALKDKLDLAEGSIKSDVENAMKGKVLAQAELIGKYKNPEQPNP